MADLPPVARCEATSPPSGYRAQYQCVSYLARAVGDYPGGRFWHAEFKAPENSDFAEFDFVVTLPDALANRFRARNIKSAIDKGPDGKPITTFSFTLYGTPSFGNCKPGTDACLIPNGMKATLFYK